MARTKRTQLTIKAAASTTTAIEGNGTPQDYDSIDYAGLSKEQIALIKEAEQEPAREEKSRAFFGILYPESVPDWETRIQNAGIKIKAILHDQDRNPDGEMKKAHVHIIAIYDGPVRYKRGNLAMLRLGCVKAPWDVRIVHSLATVARYLLHMDNPEKHQYGREKVIEIGGDDFDDLLNRSVDREREIMAMCDWVDETGCVSFRELCRYARYNEPRWHKSLTTTSGWFMKEYIKSGYWEDVGEARINELHHAKMQRLLHRDRDNNREI